MCLVDNINQRYQQHQLSSNLNKQEQHMKRKKKAQFFFCELFKELLLNNRKQNQNSVVTYFELLLSLLFKWIYKGIFENFLSNLKANLMQFLNYPSFKLLRVLNAFRAFKNTAKQKSNSLHISDHNPLELVNKRNTIDIILRLPSSFLSSVCTVYKLLTVLLVYSLVFTDLVYQLPYFLKFLNFLKFLKFSKDLNLLNSHQTDVQIDDNQASNVNFNEYNVSNFSSYLRSTLSSCTTYVTNVTNLSFSLTPSLPSYVQFLFLSFFIYFLYLKISSSFLNFNISKFVNSCSQNVDNVRKSNRFLEHSDKLTKFFSTLNSKLPNFKVLSFLFKQRTSTLRSSFLYNGNAKFLSSTSTRDNKRIANRFNRYWLTILVLLNLNVLCESKRTLYTAGFFPLSGEKADLGLGILPAVQLALDDITDNNIIPGYKLDLVGNDTMCNPAVGMKTFFDMIFAAPKKLILFGDACPAVTDPIAKASRFFHLIQLSYADTHPMYTADSYPNLFRVAPSQSAFNKARVALLEKFNWKRVGTIYENNPRYSLPHGRLLTELDLINVTIAITQSVSEGVQFELIKLKEKDVRIILGNFGETWARRIFCQVLKPWTLKSNAFMFYEFRKVLAFRHGIYGRKYQWVIAGEYSDFWWTKIETGMNCTTKELLIAIEGYIITDVLPLSSSNIITASGMTAAEYEMKYNYLRKEDYSKFHGYAYDGLWSIALAIRNAQKKLKTVYTNTTLMEFEYRDPFWSKLFRDALGNTSFVGVTGNVSFSNNERKGSMVLKQMQSGREVKIGEYHSTSDDLDLSVGVPISWSSHNNTPPLDRTIRETVPSRINLTLFIVISIFAILGIFLAFFFLFMNIKHRKQRYIKMSSPYLNNLIIIGCVFTYTSVILLGLDSRLLSEANFPYICTARAWVLMTGFTLAFGSMFSKTYRVHAIFTDIKLNKKVIKDYKLFIIVAVLVVVDISILLAWQIIDPFYRQTSQGVPETTLENEDTLIVPQLEFCQSKRMTIFLGSIYVYKGLLMAFGIFLAWETRYVSIPALNDSKYIGMSVYNVCVMCVIGAGLQVVLKDQQNAAFLIISIFIIFCSTATLCLVFMPKLIELKRNPNMDERRTRPTLKPFKKSHRESDEFELHSKIKNLSETNVRQRQRLKEKTYELEALMYRLRSINTEIQEDDNAGQLIAKVNIENIPATVDSSNKLPAKPIDHNRLNTSQLYGKQGCVVLAEESSSRSNDRETSFLSLSASASFVSSNENCAIYAHQNLPQQYKQQLTVQNEHKQAKAPAKQDDEQIGLEKNLKERLNTANSELVQEVLEGETAVDLNLANKQRNSCPELYQVQQLFSLDDNQLNKNCMERLMMLNTTMITSAIIETDSSLELVSSSSDDKTSEINTKDANVKEKSNLIASKRTISKKGEQQKAAKKHHKQSLADEQHTRKRRMVKAMSQVEPLSLIEKVREIRFAVQRSLDSAEATVSKSIGQLKQATSNKQKLRKKRKEQSISSIKSSLPPDHLSFYNHQEKNLPPLNDQIIHTASLHTEMHPTSSPPTSTASIHRLDKETHHSPPKSIHQHLSKFNKSSNQSDYFETQETYANDQLDYNLNFKSFKFKDDENQPLSCFHSTSVSPSSSSSSSPSTMLGRAPLTAKLGTRKARAKQIKEEETMDNDENVCSSAKKQRKSLTEKKQDVASTAVKVVDSSNQMKTICNRHPFTIKRRSASLDQLQTNQLCTCTRQHLHYQQQNQFRPLDFDDQTTGISTISRGPFGQLSNLQDSSNIHYMHPNRTSCMPTSITTHLITSHYDSTTDHTQQTSNKFQPNRLPLTNHSTMLTSNLTFSSSPSIKCDVVSYI